MCTCLGACMCVLACVRMGVHTCMHALTKKIWPSWLLIVNQCFCRHKTINTTTIFTNNQTNKNNNNMRAFVCTYMHKYRKYKIHFYAFHVFRVLSAKVAGDFNTGVESDLENRLQSLSLSNSLWNCIVKSTSADMCMHFVSWIFIL